MLPQITCTMAQAAGPNWMTLGIIFGVMVLIFVILLLIPSGVDKSALESDKKKPKAIEDKTDKKALPAADQTDKDKMSLAEIKEAKRASVSEDKSNEERRELRKERRAATQTANAIHERESSEHASDENKDEAKAEEKKSDTVVADNSSEEKSAESKPETATEKAVSSEEKAKSGDDKGSAANIDAVDEIISKADNDTGDVFASLFGGVIDSDLSFDDITDVPKPENGSVFPTLGSALIPLTDFAHDDDDGFDALSELTKRLEDKSEKKTP